MTARFFIALDNQACPYTCKEHLASVHGSFVRESNKRVLLSAHGGTYPLAKKRNAILAQLSEERSQPRPNELLVKAYEIWLRVYDRNTTRSA